MSMDRCRCGVAVDTDLHPDSYEYGICLCPACREEAAEEENDDEDCEEE